MADELIKKILKLLLIGVVISFVFTFTDYFFHLIKIFNVSQPQYSINKLLLTPLLFVAGFFIFNKIKNISIKSLLITLFITTILEIRYFYSYSLLINVTFTVFHSILVFILIRVLLNNKKIIKYIKNKNN